MIFVEVPIKVLVPARMETNEIGRRNFDGLSEYSKQTAIITEINSTTTGVLLRKEEKPPTRKRVRNSSLPGSPRENFITAAVIKSRAPLRISPWLTANKIATVMGAGLENPSKASLGVRTPVMMSATMMQMAVRSTGNFWVASNATAATKTTETTSMSISPATPHFLLLA